MELALPIIALGGLYIINQQKSREETNEGYTNLSSQTQQQLTHTNMNPFSGGKVRGQLYNIDVAEPILDNMTGSGSQYIRKTERPPLFKPSDNVQWPNGMPNTSDFMQSRVVPSMYVTDVSPIKPILVGPGLTGNYSSTAGTGGFNAGMEARDEWLPKTVDQMRIDTNPKMEYSLKGYEGPLQSAVQNAPSLAQQGLVQKNHPDTFYENSQSRLFTTTGVQKGETMRPIPVEPTRPDDATHYVGAGTTSAYKGVRVVGDFESSKRTEPLAGTVNHSTAVGRGPTQNQLPPTVDRQLVRRPNPMASSTDYSLLNTLKGKVANFFSSTFNPSNSQREEYTNIDYKQIQHPIGGGNQGYLSTPTVPTTVKETTLHSVYGNINNQADIYNNTQTAPTLTNRDVNTTEYYSNAGKGNGTQVYYPQSTSAGGVNRPNQEMFRPNQGGTQMFNNQINVEQRPEKVEPMRYTPAFQANATTPNTSFINMTKMPQTYEPLSNRLDPNLLKAFKDNPYTHPLSTIG